MIDVRKLTEKDLEQVQDVWKEFMDYHKDLSPAFERREDAHPKFAEFLLENINNENYLIVVATDKNKIFGYLLADLHQYPPIYKHLDRYCLLNDIAIAKAYRNKGIGRKMYNYLLDWLKEQKINRVELLVIPENEMALGFYKKIGFKPFFNRLAIEF